MATPPTFVIAGASLAGAKAAETLRSRGFEGRVVLIGDETERPYERPPLSKGYLRGEVERHKVYVHDEGFYADQGIELRTATRVQSIQLQDHKVTLDGGEGIQYDRLLLATGAAPKRLSAPGSALGGVRYLRTLADSDGLAEALGQASRVAVIGAGWIGAEVAASARQLGREVAMVAPDTVPLQRVLGPEVGAVYRDLHADHGVELHLGTGVEAFLGSERVEEVRLSDRSVMPRRRRARRPWWCSPAAWRSSSARRRPAPA